MKKINFAKIEKKWQGRWAKAKCFQVKEGKKKKYYVLEMYPYPSASGLHMGHAFNYTIGDVYARFKRMNGFNVLYPMGFDSFGLPAENAAIKAKSHPKKFTEKAISNYVKQMKELGLSYDWSRLIMSHKPDYYKWDQWIFLQMLKKGLVYKKESPVNWCPKCRTVLANEQVHNGKCEYHGDTDVQIKHLNQWYLKITDYAEELNNFKRLEGWPDEIKKLQKNWIGKSYGTDIYFKLYGTNKLLPSFTTRCDTIYSVTFLAIAPEHPLLNELVRGVKDEKKIKDFAQKLARESLADRVNEEKVKKGIFTGKYALNPVNNEKIPIYVTNFALMYGSGIVMCDAHDKRDFRFAKKYKIPLKFVISKDGRKVDANKSAEAYVDDGILFNSGKFSSMKNKEALPKMANWLEKNRWGKKVINYKLKDWLISRQRFWGTPIPIVYCDKCGVVPVPESQLPVKLPDTVKLGKGNPLKTTLSFINTKCPKCKGKAKRETDTMDTFVNSSWYYLRYCDPKNKRAIFDKKKAGYWVPVDMYIGGREHACMHLIYIRFYTKFLRDIGLLKINEPALRLFNQGMLHGPDGEKMSKSKGNVVLPEQVSKKYGIDTARLFLVSLASPDKDIDWSEKGIQGSLKFIKKVIIYFNKVKVKKSSARIESKVNKVILEITDDIENLRYNLAVIKIRGLFDSFEKEREIGKKDLESFLKMFSVFCPHIAEELWSGVGEKEFVSLSDWPVADEKKINKKFEREEEILSITVNDIINIKRLAMIKKPKAYIYHLSGETNLFRNNKDFLSTASGAIVVPFAVNDKKKHDPEGKSKKAKAGKPAIYLE